MQLLMENVFTLPRSVSQFPDNRDSVGGLIFGTLAVSGLMVRTESFQFSQISSTDSILKVIIFLKYNFTFK